MKRKVNLVGSGTLTISLPSDWTKRNHIEKGDEIEITENLNELIINPTKKEGKKEIIVDARDIKEEFFSKRLVIIPYTKGYEKIKILYNQPWFFKKIEENIYRFPGFEILDQGEGFCVLESISNLDEGELEKVYNRLYNLILNINQMYSNSIKNNDPNLFLNIVQAEKVANSLDLFCRRLLNTGKIKEQDKLISLYMIIRCLEGVSDIYRDIAKKSFGYKYRNRDLFIFVSNNLRNMLLIVKNITKENYNSEILKFKEILVITENYINSNILKLNARESDIFGHFRIIIRYVHEMSEEGIYF
jgi:phosphate uptake regulator